jgi:hypothetical protein
VFEPVVTFPGRRHVTPGVGQEEGLRCHGASQFREPTPVDCGARKGHSPCPTACRCRISPWPTRTPTTICRWPSDDGAGWTSALAQRPPYIGIPLNNPVVPDREVRLISAVQGLVPITMWAHAGIALVGPPQGQVGEAQPDGDQFP